MVKRYTFVALPFPAAELHKELSVDGEWIHYKDFKIEESKLIARINQLDEDLYKLNKTREELDRYRNGYKGSCYCCESVGERNLELEADCKAYEIGIIELSAQVQNANADLKEAQNFWELEIIDHQVAEERNLAEIDDLRKAIMAKDLALSMPTSKHDAEVIRAMVKIAKEGDWIINYYWASEYADNLEIEA